MRPKNKISKMQLFFKNAGGLRLYATVFRPEKPTRRAVLVLHGFAGRHDTRNKLAWARSLAGKGFLAMGFDFSGCGKSQGNFRKTSITHQASDVRAAMDFLKKRFGATEFGLVGHSLGGVVALACASRFPKVFAAAAISAPFILKLYPDKFVSREEAREWRGNKVLRVPDGDSWVLLDYSFKFDQSKYEMGRVVKRIKCPLLFIHGSDDKIVPLREARLYAKSAPGAELKIIGGGDHRLRRHTRSVVRALSRFFYRP